MDHWFNQTDQSWIIGSTKPTNHGSLVQPIQPIIMEQRLTKLTNHRTAINQTNQSWNSDKPNQPIGINQTKPTNRHGSVINQTNQSS